MGGDATVGDTGSVTVASSHSGSAHHADAHTVASHSDTTGTGAELETLTDGSNAESLHTHTHTVVSHSDTTGTGAELETLTDGSNAESLHTHTHTVVSHSDTTATGAELETLTDGSTTALHLHAGAALSSKVGQLTRDSATATSTQAITGVGFQPKTVIFTGAKNGTESVVYCSFTDGTYDGQTYSREEETAGNRTSNDGLLQFHQSGSGNYNSGGLTLDSDGFTINWTKAGTNSGTITLQYLAIR